MNKTLLAVLAAAVAISACGRQAEEKKPSGPPPILITVTQAKAGALEVTEETLGTLEAVIDPRIGAEVAGKVVKILAGSGKAVKRGELLAVIDDADIALLSRADEADTRRLAALLAQQERLVERQQQLVRKGFISPNAADDAKAQRDALHEQLAAARARADGSLRNQGKTRVTAPFDGMVETQIAAVGDYVKVGDPLFQLVSNQRLRAHLPFPESAAPRLKKGLPVRITSPQMPGKEFQGIVNDIKPSISETSRAIDVIVDLENDGSFRSGGTVNAAVIIARKENAVLVPEQSVVLRPAGKVVYVVAEGRAQQRVVEAGAKRGGLVEIVKGLAGGETLALDGAGFLTHNAAVMVQERAKAGAPPQDKPGGEARAPKAAGKK
ncbi:MAG: efflux RND transporter periplasmic adaptor subunit [Rhodocyclaceae bacterium]|jgi:RND family efflux transporter MFP subunit|nr:efflux RND transporter periplasmic adaptor subunit [Rhodocyclaceae bacterium]